MSLEMQRGRFTYEDLCRLPEDDLRHEIIFGEHVVTPSPRFAHQVIVGRLFVELHRFVGEHGLGVVLTGPYDVLLEGGHVLVPDLIFMSHRTLERNTKLNLQGPPDLAVEVLSPSTSRRDLGVKRDLYESSGVQEYWVVDPDAGTVLVFRAESPARFAPPDEFRRDRGNTLAAPLFPGLALPLERLFS